jgi:hypothetical protein
MGGNFKEQIIVDDSFSVFWFLEILSAPEYETFECHKQKIPYQLPCKKLQSVYGMLKILNYI